MRNCNVIIFMLKSSRLQDIQWHGKIRKAWRLLFQDAWHKERSISALSYGYRKTAAVEQFPQKNLTCSIAQTAAFFRCSVRLLANVCMLRDGLFCPYPGIQAYVRRPNTGGRKPRSSCHTRYFFLTALRYLIQQPLRILPSKARIGDRLSIYMIMDPLAALFNTVSYTHLDVYKRQGQGLCGMIGACIGGLPTDPYSQNVGLICTTKVVARRVFTMVGAVSYTHLDVYKRQV